MGISSNDFIRGLRVDHDMVTKARATLLSAALESKETVFNSLVWMGVAGYALPDSVDAPDAVGMVSRRLAVAEAVCQMLGAVELIPVSGTLTPSQWLVHGDYGRGVAINHAPRLPETVVLAPSLRFTAAR